MKTVLTLISCLLLLCSCASNPFAKSGTKSAGTCDVRCNENTQACYVTQEKPGCLTISDAPPKVCAKGSSTVCLQKSKRTVTTYTNSGEAESTTTNEVR